MPSRESKLVFHIHQRALSPPSSHLNFYIWIFTWVFFLHDKSEVQETFKKFAKRAQNEFETKIKKVRSDNGTEFKNTNIEEYLDEEGIGHEFSVPYTPQQNGIVERKNRTLIEATRTMLD